jgi:hypothetical protein
MSTFYPCLENAPYAEWYSSKCWTILHQNCIWLFMTFYPFLVHTSWAQCSLFRCFEVTFTITVFRFLWIFFYFRIPRIAATVKVQGLNRSMECTFFCLHCLIGDTHTCPCSFKRTTQIFKAPKIVQISLIMLLETFFWVLSNISDVIYGHRILFRSLVCHHAEKVYTVYTHEF